MRAKLLMEVYPIGTKVRIHLNETVGEIVTIDIKGNEVIYEVMFSVERNIISCYLQEFQFTAIGDKSCVWEKKV